MLIHLPWGCWLPQPGDTPLHQAAYKGHKLCVARLLVAKGELWDTLNKFGSTPAKKARLQHHDDIAMALEQWGTGDHDGALTALGWSTDMLSTLDAATAPAPAPAPVADTATTAAPAPTPPASVLVLVHEMYSLIRQGNVDDAIPLIGRIKRADVLNHLV